MNPGRFTSPVMAAILTVAMLLSPLAVSAEEPEPYDPEEFPRFARDLRRFEIISLGTIPLTLLFTSFGYRIYRVSTEDISWRDAGVFDADQRRRVLTIGLSLSAAVGVLDFILGRLEEE